MRQWPLLVAVAVAGMLAGTLTALSIDAPAREAAPASVPDDREPRPIEPVPLRSPDQRVLLVWTTGGLPDGLAGRVTGIPGVEAVTVVAGGRVDMAVSHDASGEVVDRYPDGWAVPLDALAIDPATYRTFVPTSERPALEGLRRGSALLGTTSSRLRRLDHGDTFTTLGGETLTVAGVVSDVAVGGAEVVVTRTDAARLGLTTDRFLLLRYTGDRAEIESAIRDAVDVEVRVRGPGETPYLRHGDAVLPQALIKDRFGEFAYRPPESGTGFRQDPRWAADHIVDADVPILGHVRCHRNVIAQLEGALGELRDRGLAHLIDVETYAGCHNPRLISPGGMPSRHAWGIAVDLNAGTNPTGLGSGQDRRLVETFARWGLTWGGFWLVPDPMHFEYVAPPRPDAAKVAGTD